MMKLQLPLLLLAMATTAFAQTVLSADAVVADPDAANDGWMDLDVGSDVVLALIGGGLSLVMAVVYLHMVMSVEVDSSKVETIKIANLIAEGSQAFLKAEYMALTLFVIVVGVALALVISWETAVNYVVGAVLSAAAGYLGMRVAVVANIRTTVSCEGKDGLNNGLKVAFRSGAVMAMSVVGLGLVGVSSMFLLFDFHDHDEVWTSLSGFAFGASSIALFARVGGGIYTKAADVGADLVGKVEEELAEDSPDNPATIADNVGDNVGDVAGMGADLFESFVGSIIASATLGKDLGHAGIALPFWVAGTGAICSIIGTLLIRASPQEEKEAEQGALTGEDKKAHGEKTLESLLASIRVGIWGSSFLVIGASAVSVLVTFGDNQQGWELFSCIMIGLLCGNLIGYFTEYATSYTYWPTQSIAHKSDTGPAPVIIQGLGVGMLSTVPPVIFIVVSILASHQLADIYGISIAAVGMLATLGVTLATDAYGPVADNAGGIAEMAPDTEISDEVRNTTDDLDALGNTTAATGKGFAIGSAVLTALALMNAFADSAGLKDVGEAPEVLDPVFLPGVLIGACLPFVFAALTMLSVGKAAESIMWECRDQLNKKWESQTPLDPQRCVAISTKSSLIEMVVPGALSIFMPLIVGTVLGARGLLGMLTGSISCGFLLAVTMANAGGAWDNAKKWVEKDNLGAGKGKHSDQHKAVVVGDTIGDPFKDTSGPALNILIKLMSVVSLVIGPELDREPWENWVVGLIISVVLLLAGIAFFYFVAKYASLHDRDAIDAVSIKRKAAGSVPVAAADVEMEVKAEAQA